MKIAVVTTFHEEGLQTYAQRMIDSFCEKWPREIVLHIYPEKCNPIIRDHSHVTLTDLDSVAALTTFKERWKDVPKANGDVTADPVRSKRKDSGKGFKWHAVRFAHKVYAITDCARTTDADILIWMDADTICHSPITLERLHQLIPVDKDLCFLGRKGKYTECGLYAMNLRSPLIHSFLTGEGHPLINSEWGAYLDHLKGDRKTSGRSKLTDLKVKRTEAYWVK